MLDLPKKIEKVDKVQRDTKILQTQYPFPVTFGCWGLQSYLWFHFCFFLTVVYFITYCVPYCVLCFFTICPLLVTFPWLKLGAGASKWPCVCECFGFVNVLRIIKNWWFWRISFEIDVRKTERVCPEGGFRQPFQHFAHLFTSFWRVNLFCLPYFVIFP